MTPPHHDRRRRAACILAAALALAGCAGPSGSTGQTAAGTATPPAAPSTTSERTATATAAATPPAPSASPTGTAPAAAVDPTTSPAAPPTHLAIPAIGVETQLMPLGLDADGALEAPDAWQIAGWWTGSASPGADGTAIIAGHVDSTNGPAVFYHLRDLMPGDAIDVTREDGSTATFRVERTERYAKDDFPTRDVYLNTPGPSLRLITCGGDFDHAVGHYEDNLVVYATGA